MVPPSCATWSGARDSMPPNSTISVKIPVDLRERCSTHTLPNGTRLAEFNIIGLIGEGGFGIVYPDNDHALGRRVARSASRNTCPPAWQPEPATCVKDGLGSFVSEVRLLAQFDSPSLVKVLRF